MVIGIQTRPILFLTFLLYVFPIILLIIGAVIGNGIAPSMQMDPSLLSMFVGFSFFGLAFYYIKKKMFCKLLLAAPWVRLLRI